MIGQLLGPITNIIGSIVSGKMEQKAAETKAKVAKAEAQAQIMLSQATSEANWEKVMAEGSRDSWKDEYLVLLYSIPLILSFSGDWGRQTVADGFNALSTMPSWYQYTLGVIVSASFGVRSASKFFGKK